MMLTRQTTGDFPVIFALGPQRVLVVAEQFVLDHKFWKGAEKRLISS